MDALYYDDEFGETPRRHKEKARKKHKPKVKKSNHKHEYRKCLVRYAAEDSYGKIEHFISAGTYCVQCGKLECRWLEQSRAKKDVPVFDTELWDKEVIL